MGSKKLVKTSTIYGVLGISLWAVLVFIVLSTLTITSNLIGIKNQIVSKQNMQSLKFKYAAYTELTNALVYYGVPKYLFSWQWIIFYYILLFGIWDIFGFVTMFIIHLIIGFVQTMQILNNI